MHDVIAWFYIIISCILQLLHGFTSAFVAYIMFMSRDPFVCAEHLQTLHFLLLFLCSHAPYNTLVIFIHSLWHIYAG